MPDPLPPDPYEAFGVSRDADLDEIRKVYRKLVLTCHPDKFPDEAIKAQKSEEFHKVQQAWELLNNGNERARYDKLYKLSKLRAEISAQSGIRGRGVEDYSPRSTTSPKYETRANAVYEERVPKPRSFEDEYRVRDFDYSRPSAPKYDDRYDAPLPTPRRSSIRVMEERRSERRAEDNDDNTARRRWKDAIKVAERTIQADKKKIRTKTRRQDYDSKHYAHSHVESDSESDSEVERFMSTRRSGEPKKRQEESRRSRHEDSHVRKAKEYDSDYSDERETKTYTLAKSAVDYILKQSGKSPIVEVSNRHRNSLPRQSSSRSAVPPPPPPPPQPPMQSIDNPRRSSASSSRRGSHLSRPATKERRVTEIVDPPRREYEVSHRPNLSSSTSSPSSIKIPPTSPKGVPRAQTMDVRSEKAPSPLRRAQTSPMQYVPSPGHAPPKSSRLRSAETHDSGYPSPATPEFKSSHTPQYTSTRYQYISEDEEEDGARTPRIVPITPTPEYRTHERDRDRDVSPRTLHRGDRSSHTRASSRGTTKRSQFHSDSRRSPPIVRSSTSRQEDSKGRLFGEITPAEEKHKVQYSAKLEPRDIVYSDHRRHGSGSDSARDHRDAYAYEFRGGRGGHPGIGSRGVSSYAQGAH